MGPGNLRTWAAAGLVLAAVTGCVGLGLGEPPPVRMSAACVGHFADLDPAAGTHRWQEAVRAANLAAVQSPGASLLAHGRVRLVFRNGGWVEFRPDVRAVADGSLPPIAAMQFASPRRPARGCA